MASVDRHGRKTEKRVAISTVKLSASKQKGTEKGNGKDNQHPYPHTTPWNRIERLLGRSEGH